MIPGTADEEAGAIVRFLGTLPQPGTGLKTAGSLGRFVGQPPP